MSTAGLALNWIAVCNDGPKITGTIPDLVIARSDSAEAPGVGALGDPYLI